MGKRQGVAYALWARLEELRIEQNLTTVKLQEISGVRRQTFMDLRFTTRTPRRDIVLALSAALGLDPEEAISLSGLDPYGRDFVRAAIRNAADMTTEQKHSLLALIDVYDAEEARRVDERRRMNNARQRTGRGRPPTLVQVA